MADIATNGEAPSRFVIGFDLGTTNSAVTFVDSQRQPWRIETFPVPQLVAAGQVEARETLPSFHYEPAEGEFSPRMLQLAFHDEPPGYVVGFLARDQGTLVPGRLIASAKSWLCHTGVDRTAAILPWQGAADVMRLSPVEVSARYLGHVRAAWDAAFPEHPMAEQDIILTLPASFDEVARELTVKAAAQAGLPRIVLIEEPQAAFYAWIYKHRDDWSERVTAGQKILVCDVGGGTSDFTLIRVRRTDDDRVQFHRVAVGNHLILGGDNFDLALARHIEERLVGEGGLEPRQWAVLVRSCRHVKEVLLGENAPESYRAHLPGSGARLVGGGMQVEVSRGEVRDLIVEGFLPGIALDEKPLRRQSGFQEFGLPYAADPAITRHLAAFLSAHRHVALDDAEAAPAEGIDPARPDVLLFNGGVFASPQLRDRLVTALSRWFAGEGEAAWRPIVLDHDRLDLAVARGAAYYGMVRRGEGVRIAAGLARTYYIGVEAAPGEVAAPATAEPQPTALCVVPAGVEPGGEVDLTERAFDLVTSEPVEFPLFVSSTRLTDRPGELIPFDREQMTALPPLRTVLRTRKRSDSPLARVDLHARLTEIGTLDLWLSEKAGRRTWRLQFDVRSATQTDIAARETTAEREGVVDEATWEAAETLIREAFAPGGRGRPESLAKALTRALGSSRQEWPTSLLRRIWEALMDVESGRRQSAVHEARWLNLVGFALRPGYGLAVDDWRVAQTWRRLYGKLVHPTPMCRAEWWILWRRIAGGLLAGWQQTLADPLLASLRGLHRQARGKGRGGEMAFGSHELAEVWRLLGSLELLPVPVKHELGTMLLDLAGRPKLEPVRGAILWAVGRIGARQPVYGPLNTVVPAETAARWLAALLKSEFDEPLLPFAVLLLARRTGDRYRDLDERTRERALAWLARREAPAHFAALIAEVGQLDAEEQGLAFGESLPKGLRIP